MRQLQFQHTHEQQWSALESILDGLEATRRKTRPASEELAKLPDLYRDICQHLSLAQSRCYSPGLIEKLHHLTLRAHHQLYKREFRLSKQILDFMIVLFPQTLRQHSRYFWLAFALFYVPGIVFGLVCYFQPDMIYSVMNEGSVAEMEFMYNPDSSHQIGREAGQQDASRVVMFGFYIKNNAGIGFQTFAGGMLAGAGTVFFLLFNGIILGGVSGYLTQLGHIDTFWGFVIGHGSFELTAVVISGMAGLLLGKAILSPGNLTRLDALKRNARQAVILISGAGIMFTIAALIEAFWSPSAQIPAMIKYIVGTFLWLLVALYLFFSGRNQHAT